MEKVEIKGRIVLIMLMSLMLFASCTKKGKNVEGEVQKNENLSASSVDEANGNGLKIELCTLLETLDNFHQNIGSDGFCTLNELQGMKLICNASIPHDDGIPIEYYIFGHETAIGEIRVYGNNDPYAVPCSLSEHACCLIVHGPSHFSLLYKNEEDYNDFVHSTEEYGRIKMFDHEENGEKYYYYVSPKQKMSKEELAKTEYDYETFLSPAYCPMGLNENKWYEIVISNDY